MSDETNESGEETRKRKGRPAEDLSTPVVKDRTLFEFLEQLFYRDPEPEEFPERIELKSRGRDGNILWTQQFAPIRAPVENGKRTSIQGKPPKERLVALSNYLLTQMQEDCDAFGFRRSYAVHAWATSRGEEPYATKMRTMEPKRRRTRDDEDEDEEPGRMNRGEKFLVQIMDQQRQMTEAVGGLINGLFDRYNRDKERDASTIDNLHKTLASKNEQLERALSLELDREERREWARAKRQTLEKSWQAVETYGPLLVGSLIGKQQAPRVISPPLPDPQPPASPPPVVTEPPASDVMILRSFLRMQNEGGSATPEQLIAALGNWDETGCTAPGVLNSDQALLLVNVAEGRDPPSVLDQLMPGGALAIQQQQLVKLATIFSLEQLRPLHELFRRRHRQNGG